MPASCLRPCPLTSCSKLARLCFHFKKLACSSTCDDASHGLDASEAKRRTEGTVELFRDLFLLASVICRFDRSVATLRVILARMVEELISRHDVAVCRVRSLAATDDKKQKEEKLDEIIFCPFGTVH